MLCFKIVYRNNNKKVTIFVMNMTFISSCESEKMYISFILTPPMKYMFFASVHEINSFQKFENLLYYGMSYSCMSKLYSNIIFLGWTKMFLKNPSSMATYAVPSNGKRRILYEYKK